MALTSDNMQAMKTLSAMTPSQISEMLTHLAAQADQDEQSADEATRLNAAKTWRQAINIVLLTLWTEHKGTRNGVKGMVKKVGGIEGILAMIANDGEVPASASAGAGAMPSGPVMTAPPLDSFGQPITDPQQAEAERIADEVLGPRGGSPPPQQRQGGNVTSAHIDGTPITDPGLLEAEAILGPR